METNMSDHVDDSSGAPEDFAQGPPPELLITKETTYIGVTVAVRPAPDGLSKELCFLDIASGHAHIFPFPNEDAKKIAYKLGSDLVVPGNELIT